MYITCSLHVTECVTFTLLPIAQESLLAATLKSSYCVSTLSIRVAGCPALDTLISVCIDKIVSMKYDVCIEIITSCTYFHKWVHPPQILCHSCTENLHPCWNMLHSDDSYVGSKHTHWYLWDVQSRISTQPLPSTKTVSIVIPILSLSSLTTQDLQMQILPRQSSPSSDNV